MIKSVVLGALLAIIVATGLSVGTAAADDRPAMGGGSGIVVAGPDGELKVNCTLTTIGNDAAGRLVGMTAAHCGQVGDLILSEAQTDAGVLGRIVSSDDTLDFAVIQFDPSRVIPVNRVGNTTITSVGAPVSFPTIVCKEGRTTGRTCGWVYGDVFDTRETMTQLCVIEGDSGAPVVVGETLVGMVNAYMLVPCVGPEIGRNMDQILAILAAGGGIGAGFRPI